MLICVSEFICSSEQSWAAGDNSQKKYKIIQHQQPQQRVFSALILRFSSTLATTRLLIRVEWLEQDNSLRLGVILGEVFLASPDECVYSKLLMTPSGRWSAETFSPLIGQSGPDSACDWSDSAAPSHQGPSSLKGAPLRHQPSSFPLSPSQVQHNTPSLNLDLGDLA